MDTSCENSTEGQKGRTCLVVNSTGARRNGGEAPPYTINRNKLSVADLSEKGDKVLSFGNLVHCLISCTGFLGEAVEEIYFSRSKRHFLAPNIFER